MPEIKIKHVVSFSSEDKVHKAENLLKEETYRKWKCAAPGEKNATIVLQFEKATEIHSIDIGNEGSAFVEVLVGRSSDSVSDYQVLLVASSFMSPLESRNGTHINRVRMFGPEKLSQNTKDEKWDCIQIVCTQPFNKNIQYGLTFIRFHSPPEKVDEQSNREKPVTKLGAFNIKDEEEDDDSQPSPGSWFGKQKREATESSSGPVSSQASPSYATAVLASANVSSKVSSQDNSLKRKAEERSNAPQEPPSKKAPLNKEHIVYKDVLRGSPQSARAADTNKNVKKDVSSPKVKEKRKELRTATTPSSRRADNSPARPSKQKVPFNKIMDKVIIALSGFVNPLRSTLREKALEMGAKYRPDWDATCTHLVCAFANTPKYEQVKKLNGHIVTKDWILHSYQKKEPLPWKKYELSSGDSSDEGDPSVVDNDSDADPFIVDDDSDADPHYNDDGDEDEDDDEESGDEQDNKKPQAIQKRKVGNSSRKPSQGPNVKNQAIKNTSSKPARKILINLSDSEDESSTTPKKQGNTSIFNRLQNLQQKEDISDRSQSPTLLKEDQSETEDEDAIQDYIADTDVEKDDSGDDTEDEIRKIEEKARQKKDKMNGASKNVELSEKPDVAHLPLPDLPDFFKKKRFFLYGSFSSSNQHLLRRYITAYNGVLEDYMSDVVKYVVTELKWDKSFDDALSENEDLVFVKPTWIFKCHESAKLVPYQPHIVIPDT